MNKERKEELVQKMVQLAKQDPEALVRKHIAMAEAADSLSTTQRLHFTYLPDKVTRKLCSNPPTLKFNPGLSHAGQGVVHRLIIGDNMPALASLLTEKRKYELIIIDPPYNTGNKDFVYNDTFMDPEDPFRHSKWLSVIKPRVVLARELLAEDGILFVFIGREEQAHLQLLLDTIFGENNRLATFSRETKSSGAMGTFFVPSVDYVLCYAKSAANVAPFGLPVDEEQFNKRYNRVDERGPYYATTLYKTVLAASANNRYYIECPDGSFAIPPGSSLPAVVRDGERVERASLRRGDGGWRFSQSRYLKERELKERGDLVFYKSGSSPLIDQHGNQSQWVVATKSRKTEDKRLTPRENWKDTRFHNSNATILLRDMGIAFDFSKPPALIEHIIEMVNKKSDIRVLDFFAGSGSTGHAVLNMNSRDGGTREVTLITNNENNIGVEVTRERLLRAITGKGWADKREHSPMDASLAVFTADIMDMPDYKNLLKDDGELNGWTIESHATVALSNDYPWLVEDTGTFAVYADSPQATRYLLVGYSLFESTDTEMHQLAYKYQPAKVAGIEFGAFKENALDGAEIAMPRWQMNCFKGVAHPSLGDYHHGDFTGKLMRSFDIR